MEKNKKPVSWGETFRLSCRAFLLFVRRYPQMVASRMVSAVWTALTPYVGIRLSALLVAELAGERRPDRLGFLVLASLFSAALIALISAFLNRWRKARGIGVWWTMEEIFSDKLLEMDYIDLDEAETGELLERIRQNQNSGGWGLYRVLERYEDLCLAAITLLGGISLTVSLFAARVPESAGAYTVLNHPLFLLAIVAVLLGITWLSPALANRAGSIWALNADTHSQVNRLFGFFGVLGQNRDVAMDVRMYRQDKICERYTRNKEGAFGSKGMFARYSRGFVGFCSAASSAVSVIFTGAVYGFVCLKAWAGAFGLGAVTQYVASITKVAGGVSQLISSLGDLRNNAAFLKQTFSFLDIPNKMYQGSLTVEKRRDRKYEVEFRNVSFRYPGREEYALRNVSMKFEVGKRLAVVGRNGSGKTTFIKLLCRLYDPAEGEILLNGIDIRKYDYAEYMTLFSVVFQDFALFSLGLGENVAASADYDEGRAEDALQKAGFGEWLSAMERGLETYLRRDYDQDGADVSGGEAQKIAIARALYKDAPFLVMDEPTAALDPVAEAEIYEKLNEIVGDKTAIYISHRLSSCKFCDEILVFGEGAVVQQGTHASLLADEGGEYSRLWSAQAQYYAES